jgi:hypothetical protein
MIDIVLTCKTNTNTNTNTNKKSAKKKPTTEGDGNEQVSAISQEKEDVDEEVATDNVPRVIDCEAAPTCVVYHEETCPRTQQPNRCQPRSAPLLACTFMACCCSKESCMRDAPLSTAVARKQESLMSCKPKSSLRLASKMVSWSFAYRTATNRFLRS